MITLFYKELSARIQSYSPFVELSRRINKGEFPVDVTGAQGSFFAFLLDHIYKQNDKPILVVLPTEQEAKTLFQDIQLFDGSVNFFPWWGKMPYASTPRHDRVFGERVRVLTDLAMIKNTITIASIRSFLSFLPPPEYITSRILSISTGDAIEPISLSRTLQAYGYLRVPRVSMRGEFALRGEVLDIFLPGTADPLRIVFEFDTVENIKRFDVLSQGSIENMKRINIYPAKELIWDDERIDTLTENLSAFPETSSKSEEIAELLIESGYFEGEEVYYPLSFKKPATLLDYFPNSEPVFYSESERLHNAAEALYKEYQGIYRKLHRVNRVPRPDRIISSFQEEEQRTPSAIRIPLIKKSNETGGIHLNYDPPRSFFGNISFLKEELENLIKSGYSIWIFAESESQALRVEHLLSDFTIKVIPYGISAGFTLPDLKIMVISEGEIFGRRKRLPRSVKTSRSQVIETFVDLNPDDYVVHVNYGIGRFKGIKRMTVGDTEKDYLHLEYAGEEYIFIPIEQVNLIQRYIGSHGSSPALDRIGGKSWESRKNRVRKSVEDLANRLITLYSKRKKTKGYVYPPDTEWQMQFEASFPYEETADQITCIEDVKEDMEQPVPMDRIICGDVGYGKTEVALRAAFKAVTAGKQAALLAPTTILAEQHYETFSERMDGFPIAVRMMSRFISSADQKKTLEGLKQGDIDLVIGTHRILQKDVHFKDLGLLIVDEEQRFGVKDKERLKEIKTSVDCLTLTATPIPRTLHMSLLKIRDMSVLTTPPYNRRPIETVINQFSQEVVAQAIRSEIERGGQIYYLHNRVETLESVQMFLQNLVPEVLVETAHGQMSSHELEDKMHRFIHGGFQVLVSTTIIENGIDIPNVNTIIIDRADIYGISQLYQLRGRVGRSERVAYAYLFYPEDRALTELSMKRLQIISDNTDLGSGFKIALKDLEVRGAGNLLGREQSGDILSVGFDMYLRLLDQAVNRLSKEGTEEPPEVYLELEYSGFIPDSYIQEPLEKMEIYKKIGSIASEEELETIYAEIKDRFGPPPEEVHSLLSLAEIRILCKKLFVSSLKEKKGIVEITFDKVAIISVNKLLTLVNDSGGRVRPDPKHPNVVKIDTGKIGLKEKSEFLRGRLSSLL